MAKATDFKTTDKVTNSLFKGAGFNRGGKSETTPAAPVIPATIPAQPNASRSRGNSSSEEEREAESRGAEVDFDKLSDMDKMCFHVACTNYDGRVNPQQWAQWWAQKESLPYDKLLRPATYLRNIVKSVGAQSVDYAESELVKFPWWSASRNWNPNLFRGYSGPQLKGILDGVMPGW